jgi:hypothetical protein
MTKIRSSRMLHEIRSPRLQPGVNDAAYTHPSPLQRAAETGGRRSHTGVAHDQRFRMPNPGELT